MFAYFLFNGKREVKAEICKELKYDNLAFFCPHLPHPPGSRGRGCASYILSAAGYQRERDGDESV